MDQNINQQSWCWKVWSITWFRLWKPVDVSCSSLHGGEQKRKLRHAFALPVFIFFVLLCEKETSNLNAISVLAVLLTNAVFFLGRAWFGRSWKASEQWKNENRAKLQTILLFHVQLWNGKTHWGANLYRKITVGTPCTHIFRQIRQRSKRDVWLVLPFAFFVPVLRVFDTPSTHNINFVVLCVVLSPFSDTVGQINSIRCETMWPGTPFILPRERNPDAEFCAARKNVSLSTRSRPHWGRADPGSEPVTFQAGRRKPEEKPRDKLLHDSHSHNTEWSTKVWSNALDWNVCVQEWVRNAFRK